PRAAGILCAMLATSARAPNSPVVKTGQPSCRHTRHGGERARGRTNLGRISWFCDGRENLASNQLHLTNIQLIFNSYLMSIRKKGDVK
ncbi:hypothetical protein, partial [Bradyrhizobium sp. Leo121]|uniref:hypothetical protein n=1 Tax=Bradyrhizobium sp. Leo121 TaxID=1571195 RepID=UPI001A914DBD